MTGYTKLFGSIIASTIWRESKETKIVWITMLAMAKKDGIVEASIPGLAVLAGVTIDEVQNAISTLSSADPYSRTKEHEGRRITVVDGGWHIINHGKYRAKMGVDERREYLRIKKAESRAKIKGNGQHESQQTSTKSTHAYSEAEAEAEAGTPLSSFDDWKNTISRMYPSQWIGVKKEIQTKIAQARSAEAKAEWKRRLQVIDEMLLGPRVNDSIPVQTVAEPASLCPEPEWKAGVEAMKAEVSSVEPAKPNKRELKQQRYKHPPDPLPIPVNDPQNPHP